VIAIFTKLVRRIQWSSLSIGLAAALPMPAHGLQPLQEFIRSARQHHPDNAEAQANLSQQEAQADVAIGRVLPGISAQGTYLRNQYQSSISVPLDPTAPPQTVVITPHDQWNGSATVSVPLVNLANFQRIAASRTATDALVKQAEAIGLQVEATVVQDYFQLLANLALVVSSQRALEVAQTSAKLTQAQLDAGRATMLDLDRANAEVERQVQLLESSRLQVALAARALESATGLSPGPLSPVDFQDDLHPEPPLDAFSPPDFELPSIAAGIKNRESAEQQARAQRYTLLPSITGNFTEFGTNTPGFVGHNYYWQAGVGFTWQLDLTTLANIRSQDAAARAARAREQRARLSARDAIHRFWNTVGADLANSRSARAQVKASDHAARLARDRYEVGAALQLDLLQAQRDAYSADVARIQSDADLANARAQLRLAAGRDPFATTENSGR
jgi:outer membrane protein TolC